MKCKVGDCGSKHVALGFCSKHYERNRRHGDPLAGGSFYGANHRLLEVALAYDGDDCLEWTGGKLTNGYGTIRIIGKTKLVHRVICEAVNGAPPSPGHEAAHSCGRGAQSCITKRHLRWATPIENMADRVIHGTTNRGERCGTSKLTAFEIFIIRNSYPAVTQTELARRFGISSGHISEIISRKKWPFSV